MKKGTILIYNGFGRTVGMAFAVTAIGKRNTTLQLATPTGKKFEDMPFQIDNNDLLAAFETNDWLRQSDIEAGLYEWKKDESGDFIWVPTNQPQD